MKDDKSLDILKKACNDIRVHNSILIIGAGASYEAGMPLSGQLAPIVWQIADEFISIKEELYCNRSLLPAKELIGDDFNSLIKVFDIIEQDSNMIDRFIEIFAKVNNKHNEDSIVHSQICKLIHRGYFKAVISFNWDDLLEVAWTKLYGTDINDNRQVLYKPHGDVRRQNNRWTLPNSPGELTDIDIKAIEEIIDGAPITFIILGYSESDERIVERLIEPNDKRYPTYRISPLAEESIALGASEALQRIEKCLFQNDKAFFKHISFSNQNDIANAIYGYNLKPSDTLSCPRLPVFEEAFLKLEHTNFVIVEGESGCGKSITAYQLGQEFQKKGYEIVEFDKKAIKELEDVKLYNDDYKAIYIIDDAQQINESIISNVRIKSNKQNKVILTRAISNGYGNEKVRILHKQTIEVLYEYYLKNKERIQPIVTELNKKSQRNIGDRFMDTPYEFALDAAKREKTPWLFNYSLRGGWSDTSNKYEIACEKNAEVLLTLVAFKQIITLDAAVDIDWLSRQIIALDRSDNDSFIKMKYLEEEGILIDDGGYRVHHLQMASRVLASFLKTTKKDIVDKVLDVFSVELCEKSTPLQGILWLFNLMFSFDIKYRMTYYFKQKKLYEKLLVRCMHPLLNDSGTDYAPHILDNIILLYSDLTYEQVIRDYYDIVKNWLEDVNEYNVYGLTKLVNGMINYDANKKREFILQINLSKMIGELRNVRTENLYVWARYIDRLTYNQSNSWIKTLYNKLPKDQITTAIMKCDIQQFDSALEMIYVMLSFNKKEGHSIYRRFLTNMKIYMNEDINKTLRSIDLHFFMYVCGRGLFEAGRASRLQKESAIAFVEAISEEMIVKYIEEGKPRDWEHFFDFYIIIDKYNSKKCANAIKLINIEMLEMSSKNLWGTQDSELMVLIYMMNRYRSKDVEEWVWSHREEMEIITPTCIYASARTAEWCVNHKKQVRLTGVWQTYWDVSSWALKELRKYNTDLMNVVLSQNRELPVYFK